MTALADLHDAITGALQQYDDARAVAPPEVNRRALLIDLVAQAVMRNLGAVVEAAEDEGIERPPSARYCPANDGPHGTLVEDSDERGRWRECADCGFSTGYEHGRRERAEP